MQLSQERVNVIETVVGYILYKIILCKIIYL